MSRHNRPNELLTDLQDHVVSKLLLKTKLTEEEASEVSYEIVDSMCSHWGGQNIYFPMGLSFKLSQRDTAIWAEFCGDNHSELAMKYKRSVQWIYKIVDRMRRAEQSRNQPGLFE